jgi:hypothetical protein
VVLPLLAEAKEEQGRGLVLLEHNLQKKKKRKEECQEEERTWNSL